jgi:hypothetical protein
MKQHINDRSNLSKPSTRSTGSTRAAWRSTARRALLALATLAPLLPLAAAAQGLRNEMAVQWAPAALASGGQRSHTVAYDREFGNGWALGGSLGYGDVHRGDSRDGAYGVVRVRHRFAPLPGVNWLQPQVGLEYGGATAVFRSAELWGVYGGVYMAASNELGFTVDLWAGRSRDENVDLFGGDKVTVKRSVTNIRLGLAIKF